MPIAGSCNLSYFQRRLQNNIPMVTSSENELARRAVTGKYTLHAPKVSVALSWGIPRSDAKPVTSGGETIPYRELLATADCLTIRPLLTACQHTRDDKQGED